MLRKYSSAMELPNGDKYSRVTYGILLRMKANVKELQRYSITV